MNTLLLRTSPHRDPSVEYAYHWSLLRDHIGIDLISYGPWGRVLDSILNLNLKPIINMRLRRKPTWQWCGAGGVQFCDMTNIDYSHIVSSSFPDFVTEIRNVTIFQISGLDRVFSESRWLVPILERM